MEADLTMKDWIDRSTEARKGKMMRCAKFNNKAWGWNGAEMREVRQLTALGQGENRLYS